MKRFQEIIKSLNQVPLLFKKYPLFICSVVLPLIFLMLYYFFIATEKYESISMVTIKYTGQPSTTFNIGIFSFVNPAVREDALYLKEYILSYDMLDYLDQKLKLKNLFQDKKIDFWQRLPADVSKEEFLKYYKKRIVKVIFDDTTGILTVKTYAFTPEDAKRINEAILEQCERFLNGISHKIAFEQMNFIENELNSAYQRMQNAKADLINFQNTYGVLDPSQEAQAIATLIAQLETQLATYEAQLKNLLTYMSEESFQVQALKSQIKALKEQIEKERSRLVGGNTRLNRVAAEYLNLKLKVDFLTDVYKATLSAYETTRVEASRKLKNLAIIASPNLPEEPLYPRKAYNLSIATILILLFYGILKIILGIIKEHRI